MLKKISYFFSILIVLIFIIVLFKNNLESSNTQNEILVKKCSRCHSRPDPDKYNNEKWVKYVTKMAGRAKLSEEEKKQLLELKK